MTLAVNAKFKPNDAATNKFCKNTLLGAEILLRFFHACYFNATQNK